MHEASSGPPSSRKVDAVFLIETRVRIPFDIDLVEFHEWVGDDLLDPSPALLAEFLRSDPDFPTSGIRETLNMNRDAPISEYIELERIEERDPEWGPGSPCGACGSTDTWEDPVEGGQCRGCGRSDADE